MPINFIGNADIKKIIESAVASGRFPHAFIIEGEKGSGRKTLAKQIAAAAICNDGNAPCGLCRECELIQKDGHCDVLTYSPDGATFKVDTIREIRDNAYIMPIEAKRKVNILLDCEKMNESAQNALLKVLEEPPQFMVFILICKNAASLLPTVRSRCVTLSIQTPEIAEALEFLLNKTEKPKDEILSILESSHGNIGDALWMLSGENNKTHDNASHFVNALLKHDRLEALMLLYKYEKDQLGFENFLLELKIALIDKLKEVSLGKPSTIKPIKLANALSIIEKTEQKLRAHVGKPLSIQIIATNICAKMFKS